MVVTTYGPGADPGGIQKFIIFLAFKLSHCILEGKRGLHQYSKQADIDQQAKYLKWCFAGGLTMVPGDMIPPPPSRSAHFITVQHIS